MTIRIRPNPFLRQPEGVMKRIQWEETPRLGVSEGIRLRIGPSPFLERPERVMERIPSQLGRFPEAEVTNDPDKVSTRKKRNKEFQRSTTDL